MDPVTVITLVLSLGAVSLSLFTHVRVSKCWGVQVETWDPNAPHQVKMSEQISINV